jgi:anthranilate phosphoribosyltransferase
VRTVFNLLGPLVNPLRPDAQVLGVARADLLDPMAGALARLGQNRAVVVHGHGGLDEATLSGPVSCGCSRTACCAASVSIPRPWAWSPLPWRPSRGDTATNRAILEAVLQGGGTAAQRDVVILNTALVLWAAGLSDRLGDGVARARTSLAAGQPWQRLVALRQALSVSASPVEPS